MKQNKISQSGRSMTEMLGTLAIIGVLSVGAITGYSYAMNKYRANKTINDVMLIGIDMITQISQGREVIDLSEWGNKTSMDYSFEIAPNQDDETQYGIHLSGIPSEVCKIIGDGLKSIVTVYVGNESYTSDIEKDPCDESNNNTMEFYFETNFILPECKTDADCGEDNYCDNGWCFKGSLPIYSYEGKTCNTAAECGECGGCHSGHRCYYGSINNSSCNNGAGFCWWGECIPTGCTTNDKCSQSEYCASPNTSKTEAFPNNEFGACVPLDFVRKNIIINGIEEKWYISNTFVSWWDAENACKRINKEMQSLDDLNKEEVKNALCNAGLSLEFWTSTNGDTSEQKKAINPCYDSIRSYNKNSIHSAGLALCK
ncbi:MAG: type II secretion system protein [Alphaproteobacteria bacterium]|nr:type II secretion system protein [Alphaproteobacteria bacterium]